MTRRSVVGSCTLTILHETAYFIDGSAFSVPDLLASFVLITHVCALFELLSDIIKNRTTRCRCSRCSWC
jgi:hypothetical protein